MHHLQARSCHRALKINFHHSILRVFSTFSTLFLFIVQIFSLNNLFVLNNVHQQMN